MMVRAMVFSSHGLEQSTSGGARRRFPESAHARPGAHHKAYAAVQCPLRTLMHYIHTLMQLFLYLPVR